MASRLSDFASRLKCSGLRLQKHKGLDSLVPFTFEKRVFYVLYPIISQPESDEFPMESTLETLPCSHMILVYFSP
jgi:hypothetical protein